MVDGERESCDDVAVVVVVAVNGVGDEDDGDVPRCLPRRTGSSARFQSERAPNTLPN